MALAWLVAGALCPVSGWASGGSWSTGIEAQLPANASANPHVELNSVSCASADDCAAVGNYYDSSGHLQGLLLSELGGRWSTGIEAPLPANANANANPWLYSVSCVSAGDCTAVGQYTDSAGGSQGLVLGESGGRWSTGIEAPLPANANANPTASLGSVSCASAGDCTAVGHYTDSAGGSRGLVLGESGGSWSTGIEAPLPANANANPHVELNSVSCASAGECTAVGQYTDSSDNGQGLVLGESGGSWSTGIEAPLPANANANPRRAEFGSVSCASAGDCTAVGTYLSSSAGYQGLVLGKSGGSWSTGIEAPLPATALGDSRLYSVSCASASDCAAVGVYFDSPGSWQGLVLGESAGSWSTAIKAALPGNPNADGNQYVDLGSVSCASAGDCTAVGSYQLNPLSGPTPGLLLDESGGSWSTGIEAPLPANAPADTFVSLGSVSCASAGECTAVGEYSDSSGSFQGLLLGESGDGGGPLPGVPANTSPPVVSGVAALGQTLSCEPGVWSNAPTGFAYRWTRDGTNIAGATSQAYIVRLGDLAHRLACVVTASNSVGSNAVGSAAVLVAYSPPQVTAAAAPTDNYVKREKGIEPQTASVKLTGSVVAGTVPVLKYHFELADSLSGETFDTSWSDYTPGRDPSVCVGDAVWCADLHALNPPIHLYRGWLYRLVVTDAVGPHASDWVAFAPGGAKWHNPPDLKLADCLDATGHKVPYCKYNLTLKCPEACPALENHNGQWQQTQFICDRSRPPGPGFPEPNVLVVQHYVAATGDFSGSANIRCSVFPRDPLTGALRHDVVGCFCAKFKVSGQVQLSVVRLHFTALTEPLLCSGPYWIVIGQVPYSCGVHNFDLNGAFDYGLPIRVGAPDGKGFSPSADGVIPPDGSANAWKLCFQNTQQGCSPPPSPSKLWADLVSRVTGLSIVPSPFTKVLAPFSFIMSLIAADPPDPRFKTISRPPRLSRVLIAPRLGVSRRAAAAATALSNEFQQAGLDGTAFLNALQRYQGALRAHSHYWVAQQTRFAARYGRRLAKHCRRIASILNRERRPLVSSRLGRLRASRSNLEKLLRHARSHGVRPALRRALAQAGLTPAQIRRARRLLPTRVRGHPHTLLGPLLSRGFASNLRKFSHALDSYVGGLTQRSS